MDGRKDDTESFQIRMIEVLYYVFGKYVPKNFTGYWIRHGVSIFKAWTGRTLE